jgi:hypothetical protein
VASLIGSIRPRHGIARCAPAWLPQIPLGLGATDLFASFVLRLVRVHGAGFIPLLWKTVAARPAAATTQDAVDNFVIAASAAAAVDFGALFVDRWRWPVTAAARAASSALGPPAVLGMY